MGISIPPCSHPEQKDLAGLFTVRSMHEYMHETIGGSKRKTRISLFPGVETTIKKIDHFSVLNPGETITISWNLSIFMLGGGQFQGHERLLQKINR